jgi:hypothetical protein
VACPYNFSNIFLFGANSNSLAGAHIITIFGAFVYFLFMALNFYKIELRIRYRLSDEKFYFLLGFLFQVLATAVSAFVYYTEFTKGSAFGELIFAFAFVLLSIIDVSFFVISLWPRR